jgi:hypothetical protein
MAHRIPARPPDIKAPRVKDEAHLSFVRQLPCVLCMKPSEACHVRFSDARYGTHTGMGRKPNDAFTVPMCRDHHIQQHSGSEVAFWEDLGIDAHALALSLYMVSPDVGRGQNILRAWRQWL